MEVVPRPCELTAQLVLEVAPKELTGTLDGNLFRVLTGPVLPPACSEDEASDTDLHEQDGPQHVRV